MKGELYSEVSPPLFSLYGRFQPEVVSLKSEESIFQHWFEELAQFDFIVIHKKGVENVNAYAL